MRMASTFAKLGHVKAPEAIARLTTHVKPRITRSNNLASLCNASRRMPGDMLFSFSGVIAALRAFQLFQMFQSFQTL
jgi:hypothetical protein